MAHWKKQFIILWIGQAVSVFTSAIVQMSLVWYLADVTKSPAILTLGTFVGFLPRAVIGIFGGVYIDRHSKKRVMLLADGFIALLSLLLAVLGERINIPVGVVLALLFGRSVGAAFHDPSLAAATPLIVPQERLTQYAGYAQGFAAASDLLSPAAAAVLYAVLPIHRIVAIDVFGAAFAAALLLFVNIPERKGEKSAVRQAFLPEFKEGFLALKNHRGMSALLMIGAAYAVIYGPIGTLFPLMSISHFSVGVNGSAVVETVFAAGTLAGSLLLGIFGRKIKKVQAIAASIGLYGAGVLAAGLLPANGFALFVPIAALMGISIPFYYGIRSAMLQMSFAPELLGRIMSLSMSLTRLAMPVGLALAGMFAEVMGVNRWFAISGVLTLALALVTWKNPALKGCCETEEMPSA